MHKGTPDEAITYMLVHKVKAAEACRKVDFCKMKLSRCIQELKESGQWEEHCADLLGHAQRMNACTPTAEAPAAAELEMATPRSLGAAIASGASRLGDGRPYGGHGNTWGEYREGHKIGSAAVAKVGVVTRANAKKASERLAEAGVHISETVLYTAAKAAPGATPNRLGPPPKIPDSLVKAIREVVAEMRALKAPELKSMVMATDRKLVTPARMGRS